MIELRDKVKIVDIDKEKTILKDVIRIKRNFLDKEGVVFRIITVGDIRYALCIVFKENKKHTRNIEELIKNDSIFFSSEEKIILKKALKDGYKYASDYIFYPTEVEVIYTNPKNKLKGKLRRMI